MVKLQGILNFQTKKWVDAGSSDLLQEGHQLNKAELLFQKIEDDQVEQQILKLENTKKLNELETKEATPIKPEIKFDDFVKMDIRVGTVIEAENLKKSKKLLKLTIDTGVDTRTVLSGIAEHFSPEEVVGQQVCVLANLAPRMMMGIESQGMVLMAENADGSLKFIRPNEVVVPGAAVS